MVKHLKILLIVIVVLIVLACTFFLFRKKSELFTDPKNQSEKQTEKQSVSNNQLSTEITIELKANLKEFAIDNVEKDIYFYAEVNDSVDDVKLYSSENDELVSEMIDDGQYSVSGDDLPSDGVYSACVKLNPQETTNFSFYAIASSGEKSVKSDDVLIKAYIPLSDKQLDEKGIADKRMGELVQSSEFKELSEEEKVTKVRDLLESLSDEGLINKRTIFYDKSSGNISFTYSCGVRGGISLREFDDNID